MEEENNNLITDSNNQNDNSNNETTKDNSYNDTVEHLNSTSDKLWDELQEAKKQKEEEETSIFTKFFNWVTRWFVGENTQSKNKNNIKNEIKDHNVNIDKNRSIPKLNKKVEDVYINNICGIYIELKKQHPDKIEEFVESSLTNKEIYGDTSNINKLTEEEKIDMIKKATKKKIRDFDTFAKKQYIPTSSSKKVIDEFISNFPIDKDPHMLKELFYTYESLKHIKQHNINISELSELDKLGVLTSMPNYAHRVLEEKNFSKTMIVNDINNTTKGDDYNKNTEKPSINGFMSSLNNNKIGNDIKTTKIQKNISKTKQQHQISNKIG